MFKSAAERINGLEETAPASRNDRDNNNGNTRERFFAEIDDEDFFTPVVVLRMLKSDPESAEPD